MKLIELRTKLAEPHLALLATQDKEPHCVVRMVFEKKEYTIEKVYMDNTGRVIMELMETEP